MHRSMKFGLLLLLLEGALTYAQSSLESLAGVIAPAQTVQPGLAEVNRFQGYKFLTPSGGTLPPSTDMDFKFKTQVLDKNTTIDEFLKGQGIKPDNKSTQVFIDLNPEFKTKKTLIKGANLTMVVPDETTFKHFKGNFLEIPASSNPKFLLGQSRALESVKLRTEAMTLPAKAYDTDADRQAHINAVSSVTRSAEAIEKVQVKLKSDDYRLATEMIEDANRASVSVNATGKSGLKVDNKDIALIQRLGVSAASISKAGKAPSYNVTVHVLDNKGSPIKGLTVYSLPAHVIDNHFD